MTHQHSVGPTVKERNRPIHALPEGKLGWVDTSNRKEMRSLLSPAHYLSQATEWITKICCWQKHCLRYRVCSA